MSVGEMLGAQSTNSAMPEPRLFAGREPDAVERMILEFDDKLRAEAAEAAAAEAAILGPDPIFDAEPLYTPDDMSAWVALRGSRLTAAERRLSRSPSESKPPAHLRERAAQDITDRRQTSASLSGKVLTKEEALADLRRHSQQVKPYNKRNWYY